MDSLEEIMNDMEVDEELTEDQRNDPDFEPMSRERANTWHGSAIDAAAHAANELKDQDEERKDEGSLQNVSKVGKLDSPSGGAAKKTSQRRNAWGTASYAEMITEAIESAPDKRLTLTQIYDWMTRNNSYFQGRSEGTDSSGWKNSIRHNLSLHGQFRRLQNEGTGKSSWWVVDHSAAKSAKLPRRRATMTDTITLEKKRNRVKGRLNSVGGGGQSSPGSRESLSGSFLTISEGGEMDTKSVYSPAISNSSEYRRRANSNASSIGGRLSPIEAVNDEVDADEKVAPQNIMQWGSTSNANTSTSSAVLWPNSGKIITFRQPNVVAQPGTTLVVCSNVPAAVPPQPCVQVNPENPVLLNNVEIGNTSNLVLEVPTILGSQSQISQPVVVYLTPATVPNQASKQQNAAVIQKCLPISPRDGATASSQTMQQLDLQTNAMSIEDSKPNFLFQTDTQRSDGNGPGNADQLRRSASAQDKKNLMNLLSSPSFCELRKKKPHIDERFRQILLKKREELLHEQKMARRNVSWSESSSCGMSIGSVVGSDSGCGGALPIDSESSQNLFGSNIEFDIVEQLLRSEGMVADSGLDNIDMSSFANFEDFGTN